MEIQGVADAVEQLIAAAGDDAIGGGGERVEQERVQHGVEREHGEQENVGLQVRRRVGRPPKGSKAPRCQMATCMEEKKGLREKATEQQKEIERMRATWDSEIAGAKRHYESRLLEEEERLNEMKDYARQMERLKNSYLAAFKAAEASVAKLTDELAVARGVAEVYAQDALAAATATKARARSELHAEAALVCVCACVC